MQIINGDSLVELQKLPENSVDSVVCDPPYGLSFMGKKWDYDVPTTELWKEVYRVLKPGGHLLSFFGTRTYHRGAVRIEDAGFEIRDMVSWVYGSGFPKSHNIGKAVDKLQGNEREIIGKKNINAIKALQKFKEQDGRTLKTDFSNVEKHITKGNSPYEGWGTALKPSNEPIVLARKPLSEKTITKNVLEWGTGGINIDECRVESNEDMSNIKAFGSMPENKVDGKGFSRPWMKDKQSILDKQNTAIEKMKTQGRFPANLILDGSEEATAGMGDKARYFYVAKASKKERNGGLEGFEEKTGGSMMANTGKVMGLGGASLKGENKPKQPEKNSHPTVKPVKLMQYLVRLVTPKGGTVLDPFMGSGSTGIACKKENFDFIGIDLDAEYCKIAEARIFNSQ